MPHGAELQAAYTSQRRAYRAACRSGRQVAGAGGLASVGAARGAWSREQQGELLARRRAGETWPVIAQALGRCRCNCIAQARALGIQPTGAYWHGRKGEWVRISLPASPLPAHQLDLPLSDSPAEPSEGLL